MTGAVIDTEHAFARGLQGYIAEVARQLGIGLESCTIDPEPPASAYLALDWRLERFPELDLALLWDEHQGWSAALESRTGEDLITLAFYGDTLLPDPAEVRSFLEDVRAGDHQLGQPGPPRQRMAPRAEILPRLAAYAEHAQPV